MKAKKAFSVRLSGSTVSRGAFSDGTTMNALPSGWSLIVVGDNSMPVEFCDAVAFTPPAAGTVATSLIAQWAWDAAVNIWCFYRDAVLSGDALARSEVEEKVDVSSRRRILVEQIVDAQAPGID